MPFPAIIPILKAAGSAAIKTAGKAALSKGISSALSPSAKTSPPGFSGGASVYDLPASKLNSAITQMDETQYTEFLTNAPPDFRQKFPDLPYL